MEGAVGQSPLRGICRPSASRVLADGYETSVGQGGGALSGGQKRRLQLLLLLLNEPNLIALDEPANDVDADMLAAMQAGEDAGGAPADGLAAFEGRNPEQFV